VLAGGLFGASALADGDPASDVLITQTYYVPADANASAGQDGQLASLLRAADRAGLPIRLAVIPAKYDLGSAFGAWRRPQAYSEFLGYELSNSYKSALLIVMPNGFGLNWPGHSPRCESLRRPVGYGSPPPLTLPRPPPRRRRLRGAFRRSRS